jgi:RNA polymerase sigma-70 factor (ECF subfamily)
MPDFANNNKHINTTLKELKRANSNALKYIFNLYSERLFYHALKFVNSTEIAEEIIQDVFVAIWKNRNELNIQSSLESYLYSSVKNRSISYLRKKISIIKTEELSYAEDISDDSTDDTSIEYIELRNELKRAIDSLPERCRIIFTLSRNSGLTYKQIADELNISPESVKTQIGIALKKLKIHLKKFQE